MSAEFTTQPAVEELERGLSGRIDADRVYGPWLGLLMGWPVLADVFGIGSGPLFIGPRVRPAADDPARARPATAVSWIPGRTSASGSYRSCRLPRAWGWVAFSCWSGSYPAPASPSWP